jgi:Bacterial conjugation TrbI-like protein
MTPRTTINFFRSRTGGFVLFLVLLIIGYLLVNGFKPPSENLLTKQGTKSANKTERKSQVVETVTRDMTAFNPPKEPPAPTLAPMPEKKNAELPPISLYSESSSDEKRPDPLSENYAPFGRLIQCELVITVDSSSISTPIIGLVTDDVWHDGRLIIPAGTEVHGTAKVDRVRERIASSGNWTLVWHTGEELTVKGLALDREKDQEQNGWGITDGSAGLRGELLKSDDLAEIKLFAATFLSGAASSLTEREHTIFGSQAVPSLQNAPLAGAQQVLNVYAKQILDSIQRDGFYVRVAAGKQFYLYVTQTVDKSRAVIGGTRLAALKNSEEPERENIDDSASHRQRDIQRFYPPVPDNENIENFRRLPPTIISPQPPFRR